MEGFLSREVNRYDLCLKMITLATSMESKLRKQGWMLESQAKAITVIQVRKVHAWDHGFDSSGLNECLWGNEGEGGMQSNPEDCVHRGTGHGNGRDQNQE